MQSKLDTKFNLSVVVAFKDQYDNVRSSVESIFKQSIMPDQVLLVDCGSTDGGINKLQREFGSKVDVLRHCKASISEGRNDSLRLVSSNYVVFMQAGDLWEPHFVSELSQLYKQFDKPQLMATPYPLYDSDDRYQDPKIRVMSQASRTLFKNYFSASNAGDVPLVLSSLCVSVELFAKGIPFEFSDEYNSLRLFLIKVALAAPIAYSQKIMVFKKLVKSTIALQELNDAKTGVPKFMVQAQALLDDDNLDKGVRKALRKYLSLYLLKLADHKIDHGDCDQAKQLFGNVMVLKGIYFAKVWFKYFLRSLGSARHKDLLY
jgi:glycosyltransferase involved in cell wall biosynthesis